MFREWATPPRHTADLAALQHPKGGASAIARELVRAIERDGRSKVRTRARVRRVIVEGGRAIGVELTTGEVLHARRAVICGVSSLDVPSLIKGGPETKIEDMCPSFMHLHVAVQMTEDVRKQLPGGRLEGNYVSVEDWEVGVETAGNVVLISVPSVLDSDVAPEGWAVLHAYTPATEPWEMWEGLKRGSKEYEEMKEVRVKPLWRALKRVFGQDVRQIAQIQMVASPLTHAHFLNRCRGSYGPRVDARKEGLGLPFPGSGAFPTGFFRVGDGVFPGVGVPAVAGSAWMVANGIVSVEQHLALLDRIGL